MNERPRPGEIPPNTPGNAYVLAGSILTYDEYVAFQRDCQRRLEELERETQSES